jgi:hypothetical protein
MVRMVLEELLPFVSREIVNIKVVMSNSINKPPKHKEVVAIETDRVIISSRWNVACCVLLRPFEGVHIELIHMLVVFSFAVGASNHVHALGIYACLVMSERTRRISLVINLLP